MTQPTQDPKSYFTKKLAKEVATYKDKELLTPATKPLDEQIDEILADSIGMDFCENDECSHYGQYLEAHTAIKALIANAVLDELRTLPNHDLKLKNNQAILDRIKELEEL